MRLVYDRNLKIAGIAIVPWNRLGPEQWLSNYVIASYHRWDVSQSLPRAVALADYKSPLPKLERQNTSTLLQEKSFLNLLNEKLPGYDLLTYKSVKVPSALRTRRILMTEQKLGQTYENKADFRELLHGLLPFPDFQIIKRNTLSPTRESYEAVTRNKPKFIQDEYLSGGKGSFVVKNYQDFCYALEGLDELSHHPRVVVSDFIPKARERTIQGCVTRYGVFTGPLQRQLVAHPLLVNPSIVRGDKFSGAQILAADQDTALHQEIAKLAILIGESLKSHGYKGIFGVDFLEAEDGKVYVLEVNPRLTGVSPLLAALYKGKNSVPFYLLHLLELGDYEYQIEDKTSEFGETGALLLLHSFEPYATKIVETLPSGTYRFENGDVKYVSKNIELTGVENNQFIIQAYLTAGSQVLPAGQILGVQLPGQILDENTDELYNSTVEIISVIKKHIILKPLTSQGNI